MLDKKLVYMFTIIFVPHINKTQCYLDMFSSRCVCDVVQLALVGSSTLMNSRIQFSLCCNDKTRHLRKLATAPTTASPNFFNALFAHGIGQYSYQAQKSSPTTEHLGQGSNSWLLVLAGYDWPYKINMTSNARWHLEKYTQSTRPLFFTTSGSRLCRPRQEPWTKVDK